MATALSLHWEELLTGRSYYRRATRTLTQMARDGAWSGAVVRFVGPVLPDLLALSKAQRVAWAWRALPTRYVQDPAGDDWQTPEETLRRREGDCEDWSVLLAAILILLGLDARVGVVPGHAAVFVSVSRMPPLPVGYVYRDAIPSDWRVVRHLGQQWLILESTTLPGQRKQPGWDDELVGEWLNTDRLWLAGTANG